MTKTIVPDRWSDVRPNSSKVNAYRLHLFHLFLYNIIWFINELMGEQNHH